MAFFAIDELIALGHGRSFAKKAAAFFAELVLLTQLPVLRSQLRDLSRLGGLLAVLVGGMIFPVPGDPVTHRLGHKIVRGRH